MCHQFQRAAPALYNSIKHKPITSVIKRSLSKDTVPYQKQSFIQEHCYMNFDCICQNTRIVTNLA